MASNVVGDYAAEARRECGRRTTEPDGDREAGRGARQIAGMRPTELFVAEALPLSVIAPAARPGGRRSARRIAVEVDGRLV